MNTVNCSCGNPNSCGCSCGCCESCKFNPCAVTCAPCCANPADYAYVFNTAAQTVAEGAELTFSSNGPLSGTITHTAGTAEITIGKTGVYLVSFTVSPEAESQISAYKNGTVIEGATFGGTEIFGQFIISAQVGDVIALVNTGAGEITLAETGTAPEAVVNASVTVTRLF